jgi:FAD/FMN-containing dehydrogenase
MNLLTRIDRSALSPLEQSFSGRLLLPGDDGYETARRVHNGMIDRRPSIIARCSGTADVVHALDFAIRHDLGIAVRGGGHNVAGRAVIDDGMMIDLSPMKGIDVDPEPAAFASRPASPGENSIGKPNCTDWRPPAARSPAPGFRA